jgi:hypothetical protein
MVVEITEQLTRGETKFTEGSKERTFINRVKDALKSLGTGVTSVAQLILLLLKTAEECGLSVEDMGRIFGG